MTQTRPSWLSYMSTLQQKGFSPGGITTAGLERILELNQLSLSVFNHSVPWFYLLDYTSGRYLVTSKSVETMMGYSPGFFLDGGLALILEKYHSEHLRLFNKEIFPDRLDILRQIPPEEHPNYVFSYNLRIRHKEGKFVDLLQRNCFVRSDEQGNPLLSFGVITNVTHFNAEGPVIQVVERVGNDVAEAACIAKKTYYLNKEDSVFTKRELEVLKWTIEGCTHKEIAEKLFIAEGTVLLHRKNMLSKSNTRNVAELVAYAFRNRLI